ncbi:MAG: UDP-N-acetylmuramoylalanyl-D-glutamyl-2,6-diaminopimelate--D-alanyl-D-alanine ligase [Kiloniellales bacterium]
MSKPALWTSEQAAAATGGKITAPWAAVGVSIDSRSIAPGELFVALKGPNFDGHDFAAQALARGAAAAMVSRRPRAVAEAAPLLEVDDTMTGLEALARGGRERVRATIIGVTGSVGKTGTKEALRLALEGQGPTYASEGNLNNQWGVPLSLARMPAHAAYGVFEIAMSHPGEIAPLARMVRPDIAVITAVEPVHLAFFDSVDEIADAKAEMFDGMTPAGIAVLNRDNRYFSRLRVAAAGLSRVIGFGAHPEAEVRLVDCTLEAAGSAVTASLAGRTVDYRLALPGRHNVLNSLAVLAAVWAAGADPAVAAEALARLEPLEGRGQQSRLWLPEGSFELIDESYNASPASMVAALRVLAASGPGPAGRRIAVLGDMLELGRASGDMHRALARDIAELPEGGIDLVFTAGADMARLHAALPAAMRADHAPDSAALAPLVAAAVRPGDVVMVKGSLGSRMAVVVAALGAAEAGHGPPSLAVNQS